MKSIFNFFAQVAFLINFSIHLICKYVHGISIFPPSTYFPSASLGDPVTSASNDSIVSVTISGRTILANVFGTCPVVSHFVDDTFVVLRLCLLTGSRAHFKVPPKLEDLK